MLTRKRHSLIVILLTLAVLFVASTAIALAKTEVKKVVYQGSGKVSVYFKDSVSYDDVKILVKDNANNSYKTSVQSKSESKIQIKISGYKTGKTYKLTIDGLSSGDAVCSFKIYSKSKAVQIAKDKSKATGITDIETKSDKYNGYAIWRISFDGKIKNKDGSTTNYHFTYLIRQQTGKVMTSKREQPQ